ncbi:hypothetical protein OJAV_G00169470 [Oryzias javanicus]|uniref:THAP-type domain-containing protein n=1 Tax=Oryzias javanicus TaxID=123683 RepID=A0A3S2MKC0_ORYJA|nr:hypothetical protein OJAV_G00169470 [Oryzias javanicus]
MEVFKNYIDVPQLRVFKEEKEEGSFLDQEQPELPQMKKEEEQLLLKQEIKSECGELFENQFEDVSQFYVCKEENKKRTFLDQEQPEPTQMKEEEEELCCSQQEEQQFLKQEIKSERDEIFVIQFDDLSEKNIHKEETDAEQLLWKQERKSSLDEEEPELPQIKEEWEEVCIGEEEEQLELRQETDAFMVTEYDQENMNSELEPIISRQGEITKNLSIERRKEWLAILNLKDTTYTNLAHLRVCSDHFVKGKPSVLYDTTNPDWAPSLNLGHNNSKNAASDVDRFERKMSQVLNVKKKAAASALVKLGTDKDECHQMEMSCGPSGKEIQPGFNSNVMNTMPCEIGRLSSENSSLNDLSDNNICKEKTEAEPLLWKQEKSSSLDKEESEAPQIKEEGEEVCIIEEGDQLDGKEKTGGFIVTEYDQQKMDSKSEPTGPSFR